MELCDNLTIVTLFQKIKKCTYLDFKQKNQASTTKNIKRSAELCNTKSLQGRFAIRATLVIASAKLRHSSYSNNGRMGATVRQ